MLMSMPSKKLALYQKQFVTYLESLGVVDDEKTEQGQCRHEWKTTKGSNGYEDKLICLKCGAYKTSRKDELKYLHPDSCPRANVTNLKSTTKDVKWYCLDCHTVVETRSRAEHIDAEAAAKAAHAAAPAAWLQQPARCG